MPHYDLIVIGSGPAGEMGAIHATHLGKRVALIEAQPRVGGAGINTGTLPSKTLRESALHLSGLEQRGLYGLDYKLDRKITVDSFMARKRQVVDKQLELTCRSIESHKIDLINGRASFVDPHTV